MSDVAYPELGPAVFERLFGFFDALRDRGFGLSTGRRLDAVKSVRVMSLQAKDEFRIALRANLCGNADEQKAFDLLFDAYWLGREPREREDPEAANTLLAIAGGGGDRSHEGTAYSPAGRPARAPVEEGWLGFEQDMERAIRLLRRLLRNRKSRRYEPSTRGGRLDVRRSLHRYLRNGREFVSLERIDRKRSKARLVCLVDVSNSMSAHAQYLVRFLFAVHRLLPGSLTVLFSSEALDVSALIEREPTRRVLDRIADRFRHWSGGTRIGAALEYSNALLDQRVGARNTIVILSDGFDQGDPAVITGEMAKLKRRAKAVIWINPLLHTQGYQPVARGMAAAMPFIDHFLPAHDGPTLLHAVRRMAKA